LKRLLLLLVCTIFLAPVLIRAQEEQQYTVPQKDILDQVYRVLNKTRKETEPDDLKKKKNISLVPAIGYTLQTGFAAILSGNLAFYTDTTSAAKMSVISSSITYSQYSQIIVPVQFNVWADGDNWNIVTDFRYIKYPSDIYGLGGPADPAIGYTVDFSGIKFHQTVLRKVAGKVYAGAGYFYDKFYNIHPSASLTPEIANQVTSVMGTREEASGLVGRFLYDNRLNPINSKKGVFFNVLYRNNMRAIGSDSNWQSLQIDARTYIRMPANSSNVLALWTLQWLTTSGSPPFLLLPSTGWDDNYNSGRGYIQGRFRGRNMHYAEAEYRYRITRNGFIGGVAFVNLQRFSGDLSEDYTKFQPGYGLGLRIKLNKYSDTNLCIDYGFGSSGSKGFFVNLAEVF
jgi:hypothetical protein